MNNYVSFAPHIKSGDSTNRMYIVLVCSLIPALLVGLIFFGFLSIFTVLICVLSVVASEIAFNFYKYKKFMFNDYSTILVGVLIGMTMPPKAPILYPVLGAVLSNILVKNCMGGSGKSVVSEVAFAKVVTFIAFSSIAECYVGVFGGIQTSQTLLDTIISGAELEQNIFQLIIGFGTGAIGEMAILFVLAGGVFACIMKIVDYKVPVIYLVTILLMSFVCFGTIEAFQLLMAGGVVLCAFYLLTDFACMPKTLLGKVVYSVIAGVITVLYWKFGKNPNLGAFYAVLIVGIVANAIKGFYRPRIVGEKR